MSVHTNDPDQDIKVAPEPAVAVPSDVSGGEEYILAGKELGTTHLFANGKTVLVPPPSKDPKDPLLFRTSFKIYVTIVVSWAAFLSNMIAAGPAVDIVTIAIDLTGLPPNIAKTAYLFSATSLTMGISNLFYAPIANKYGRRGPLCFMALAYFLCAIWAALATSFSNHLGARLMMGLASGGIEVLAPLIISDVTFLHERSLYMGGYVGLLSCGAALGSIADGLLLIRKDWRFLYWFAVMLLGLQMLMIFFTIPETAFRRTPDRSHLFEDVSSLEQKETADEILPAKKSYLQSLKMISGTYTDESLLKMFLRPFGAIFLPAVLFAALDWGVTIGFLVGATTNVTVAFESPPYLFTSAQVAYVWFSPLIGVLFSQTHAGFLADWIGRFLAKRNNGIFEPEFRLPPMILSIITLPLGLALYGAGIQHQMPWIAPVFALGLLNYSIVSANQAGLVYAVDVYKPIAGEVVTSVMAFKAIFAFAVSFGTNKWIEHQGYQRACGEMAAIAAAVLVLFVPMYIWGKRIRQASLSWRLTRWVGWNDDRDDVAVVIH